MITLIALPPDFNPIEEANLEKIRGYKEWDDYIEWCNEDEELAKLLMVQGIIRLNDRGKLVHGSEMYNCEDPEFAFAFIRQLVSLIFPFQVDNELPDEEVNNCIVNVMVYAPKIQYLLDPEYSFERCFSQTASVGDDEDEQKENEKKKGGKKPAK